MNLPHELRLALYRSMLDVAGANYAVALWCGTGMPQEREAMARRRRAEERFSEVVHGIRTPAEVIAELDQEEARRKEALGSEPRQELAG
jgi:hypothetical protein